MRVILQEPTIRSILKRDRESRLVSEGNLLIEKSGGGDRQPVGAVVLYEDIHPAVCSNFVARVELAEGMDPSFWRYVHAAAYAVRLTVASIKQTSGIQNLDQASYFNERAAFPTRNEQSAIASFLDHETSKIDALVAEQERLIALLKEKRQAVISQTVTKGLDPNVPVKDSRVKWIGHIPCDWMPMRIKNAVSHVVDCLHTTPTYDGDLCFPAVRTADVDRGRLHLSNALMVSKEVYEDRIQRLRPEGNDILYSREGERFGMAALVPLGVDICLGQRMMMFRARPEFNPAYLMWVLNSDSVYQQVLADLAGATSPHVNISDVINFFFAAPPKDEQQRIAQRIEIMIQGVDELTAEAERAITLLRERRAALITAAVTGKIDVRDSAVAAQDVAA
jgi:type I restriction enzyme S subunit